jgi:hypothetical protein
MSKVEELREQIRAYLGDIDDNQHRDITKEAIDSLIVAARAEGAEQERERIRRYAKPIDNFFNQMSLVIPASVLSPAPKEAEQDNTTEEEYEDMRRNGGPRVKP